jgi:hypothetical protein
MEFETTAEERIRAQIDAWRQGYDVHIGCGGECTREGFGNYHCHGCERIVPQSNVAPPVGPADEDAEELLKLLDAARAQLDKVTPPLCVCGHARMDHRMDLEGEHFCEDTEHPECRCPHYRPVDMMPTKYATTTSYRPEDGGRHIAMPADCVAVLYVFEDRKRAMEMSNGSGVVALVETEKNAVSITVDHDGKVHDRGPHEEA